MASTHQFGGTWTDDKLDRLSKYLLAYLRIFTANPYARRYNTTFVDAFAGTGYRNPPKDNKKENKPDYSPMFIEDAPVYDEEAKTFQKGSARIALELDPPFGRYIFIEKKPEYIKELEVLRESFPALSGRVEIRQGEANTILKDWCHKTNWGTNRAVVFLDPYGMAVEWSSIETLARTKAIDLWLLFPLGQAVNRLLTRDGPPQGALANSLTRLFGTETWESAFYRQIRQTNIFGEEEEWTQKEADFEQIARFFIERLQSVFPCVADNPLYLRNRKNVPIYLLCFAACNERGGPTAVKIAKSILGK
jgi:three-Cys-motif partner protein